MRVVKGGVGIGTGHLDDLEVVVGGAFGRGRIVVFDEVCRLLGGNLHFFEGVLGPSGALLGHLSKFLRYFHLRQVEFRNLVVWQPKRAPLGSVVLALVAAMLDSVMALNPLRAFLCRPPDPPPQRGSDVARAVISSAVDEVLETLTSP